MPRLQTEGFERAAVILCEEDHFRIRPLRAHIGGRLHRPLRQKGQIPEEQIEALLPAPPIAQKGVAVVI